MHNLINAAILFVFVPQHMSPHYRHNAVSAYAAVGWASCFVKVALCDPWLRFRMEAITHHTLKRQ
jgi:hypothetical protein